MPCLGGMRIKKCKLFRPFWPDIAEIAEGLKKIDLVLTKIVEILKTIRIHIHAMIVYSRAISLWIPKFLHEFHTSPTGNIWVFKEPIEEW